MSIDLVTAFSGLTDEKFIKESKSSLLTNKDYNWTGAKSIKVYKISTAVMNDYDRAGTGSTSSRYGTVQGIDATTEELSLRKDRSFTFAIDKMDTDETGKQLAAATALERQLREVVVPEVDKYVYNVICENAGTKATATVLTAENIYSEIIKASKALDDNEVPETERVLLVSPDTYMLMKQSKEITLETDITAEMRLNGVISNLDGASVIKVPSKRLPDNFGFAMVHPSATVAPIKLADYNIHSNPPGISGDLIEGRIYYDAFVLDNKTKAIYYQPITAA